MPKSEYIIHGTQTENLIKILKDGYIDNNPDKKYMAMLGEWGKTEQIFAQLIYKDIPNEAEQNPMWGMCAIILDRKILKDYPFYATHIGSFKDKFENGMTNSEDTIISSRGNLSRMPNLAKLKTKIEKSMKFGITSFIHSHEILFNQRIPLAKYCKCIMCNPYHNPEEKRKLIKLASSLDIPIKFYELKKKHFGISLNNFIDMIDTIDTVDTLDTKENI
jgi:hypothetical protein